MKKQEVLLNLLLLVIIGTLVFYIMEAGNAGDVEREIPETTLDPDDATTETTYNATLANAKYKTFGKTDLFKPLLTPTPTPPPPTPAPTKTPDINATLASWKLEGIMDGEVMIFDKAKEKDPDAAHFNMQLGGTRPIDVGKGEMKTLKVIKVDEMSDNPNVTFSLEGTDVEKNLKLIEEGAM